MSDVKYIKNHSGKVVSTIESTPYSSTSYGSTSAYDQFIGQKIDDFFNSDWIIIPLIILGLLVGVTTGVVIGSNSGVTTLGWYIVLGFVGGIVGTATFLFSGALFKTAINMVGATIYYFVRYYLWIPALIVFIVFLLWDVKM